MQLCEAKTGRFQFDKPYFFSWKLTREDGKFKVENIECALEVNKKGIIQLKVKEVIRELRVYMCPKLHWDDQFQVMKLEMIDSISNLNNKEIKMCLF